MSTEETWQRLSDKAESIFYNLRESDINPYWKRKIDLWFFEYDKVKLDCQSRTSNLKTNDQNVPRWTEEIAEQKG